MSNSINDHNTDWSLSSSSNGPFFDYFALSSDEEIVSIDPNTEVDIADFSSTVQDTWLPLSVPQIYEGRSFLGPDIQKDYAHPIDCSQPQDSQHNYCHTESGSGWPAGSMGKTCTARTAPVCLTMQASLLKVNP